jgi:carotenoid cleavage dioxygenase-like enzyme
VFNAAGYIDPTKNPFSSLNFDSLNSLDNLNDYQYGSAFSEITIDLEAETVEVEDLIVLDKGNLDLPMSNPQWSTKENCFTYLSELFSEEVKDESYAWKIIKYDRCNKQRLAEFRGVSNEATYIADPNGTEEDDGIILT